jgi:hypothetical protein
MLKVARFGWATAPALSRAATVRRYVPGRNRLARTRPENATLTGPLVSAPGSVPAFV